VTVCHLHSMLPHSVTKQETISFLRFLQDACLDAVLPQYDNYQPRTRRTMSSASWQPMCLCYSQRTPETARYTAIRINSPRSSGQKCNMERLFIAILLCSAAFKMVISSEAFCEAGNFLDSADVCRPCPAGTFSDTAGVEACTPCPVGSSR
jgi:hypothetical protein